MGGLFKSFCRFQSYIWGTECESHTKNDYYRYPNFDEERMRATDRNVPFFALSPNIPPACKHERRQQISKFAVDLHAQPDRFPVRLRLIVLSARNLPTFPFPTFPRLELDDEDLQMSARPSRPKDTCMPTCNSSYPSYLHMAA